MFKQLMEMNKRKGEKAVTTVECAVMLVLIAIAVMGSNPGIAGAVTNVFRNMATALNG